jgi:MFS family permease
VSRATHAPLGPSYRKLVTASGFSNVADGVFQVALPLLAVRLTQSPAAVAGLTFAARLPWLVFGVLAGALADRLDRRATMVRVDIARAALIGGLALLVVAEHERLWVLYAVALLLGIGETVFDTSSQSLMPAIVARDDLSRANGRLYAVEMGMNQFVGPPLGGLLVAAGVAVAFATSAGGYVAAGVVLATLTGSFRPERASASSRMRDDIAEGVRFLWRHRVLRALSAIVAVSLLSSTAAFALFPLFVIAPGPLGLSEVGFGLLLTAAAAGSLLSSLVTERVERRLGRNRTLVLCVVVDGVSIGVLAVGNVVVAVLVGIALGFSQVLFQVVSVSLRQRLVPNELLGRVTGVHRTLAMGSMVVGAALGGLLAEAFGIRPVLVGAGVLSLASLLLLPILSDRAIAEAESRAAEAVPAT